MSTYIKNSIIDDVEEYSRQENIFISLVAAYDVLKGVERFLEQV